MFIFDENIGTFRSRSRKLGMPIDTAAGQRLDHGSAGRPGRAVVRASSPRSCAAPSTARDGDGKPAKVVIIDSLNGYLNAMPEEKFLTAQLHELLAYLGQQGVVTILTRDADRAWSGNMHSPVDTTYLADNVVLFRYFEAPGWVRRAISVVKKRSGKHERTIRELDMNEKRHRHRRAARGFQGVLTGVPTYVGKRTQLMGKA